MNKKAFTLIEILIAVLIIGILAAISISQYQKVILKTKATELIAISKKIRENQKHYYLVNNQYTGNINDLDIELPACEWTYGSYSVGTCPNGLLYVYKTGMISIYIIYDENKSATLWINLFYREAADECADRETTNRCKTLGYQSCYKDNGGIYRCYNG